MSVRSGSIASMNPLQLSQDRLEHLRHLEAHLCEQIRGQDDVISRVVPVLHRGELDLSTPGRPRGSFLLGGKLGEIGLLGLAVAKSSTGTLLFDEIEKAHPRVLDVFLQILDAARLTMANGETLDLSGFYIVFTSNLGGADILNLQHSSFATMERHVLARAQQSLRPELFARMTERLVFDRLSYDVQLAIAKLHVSRELAFLRGKGFNLTAGDSIISFIIQRGFHPRLGARPLRDAIEKHLRGAIAEATLAEVRLSSAELVVCGDGLVVMPVSDA